jgi:hypothetical protein
VIIVDEDGVHVVSLISNISAFQNTFFPLKSKTTSSIKSQLEVEDVIVDA